MKRRDFIKTSLGVAVTTALTAKPLTSALAASPIKVGILIPLSGPAGLFGPSSQNCAQMAVDEINAAGGIKSMGSAMIEAMLAVPRHEFVPDDYLAQAYADHPLPIGYGQTISQPYIVALMTEAIDLEPGDTVLEIGTGSGYQAAVLAELGFVQVYSIEIVPELAERAAPFSAGAAMLAESLRYLELSGRSDEQVALVESYMKAQGMFHTANSPDAEYSALLELALLGRQVGQLAQALCCQAVVAAAACGVEALPSQLLCQLPAAQTFGTAGPGQPCQLKRRIAIEAQLEGGSLNHCGAVAQTRDRPGIAGTDEGEGQM